MQHIEARYSLIQGAARGGLNESLHASPDRLACVTPLVSRTSYKSNAPLGSDISPHAAFADPVLSRSVITPFFNGRTAVVLDERGPKETKRMNHVVSGTLF